jgi:hypothetical protein
MPLSAAASVGFCASRRHLDLRGDLRTVGDDEPRRAA